MKRYLYMAAALVLLAASSCKKDPEIRITASFTTDKEVYNVGDKVVITNTTTVENAHVAINKWEYQGKISYDETPPALYFEEEGEYAVKLTVTADLGAKKSSFEKIIKVVDNNIRPVADFSYLPEEITAGEPIQFTDLSTDEDGQITAWEWKFGSTTSTKQHPLHTFTAQGEVEVSLTVTDNNLGRNTKTITVDVKEGRISLKLAWSQTYENTDGAYVWGTSPAVSPDGKSVYVTSTGYKLVGYTDTGALKWTFDLNPEGKASAHGGSNDTPTSIRNPHPTPSVDEDGTVYAALGYNYEASTTGSAFLYAVNGGNGTQKWVTDADSKGHMTFFAPVVTEDYVMMAYRNGTVPNTNSHLQVRSRLDGSFVFGGHCNSGSRGGLLAMKDGKIVIGVGGHWGYRLYFPNGEDAWQFSRPTENDNAHNLGNNGSSNGNPYSSQPAAGEGGKIYLLMRNNGSNNYFTNLEDGNAAVVYYESISNFQYGTAPAAPTWVCPIKGNINTQNYSETGNGVAVGEDGTIYAVTSKEILKPVAPDYVTVYGETYKSWITAVSATGTIKWEHQADGNIEGVPAIDDEGYIYYNDCELGKLVMLDPVSGEVAASIDLGEELRSSPTVSYDGKVYATGMKDGKPTVFAVTGPGAGCADSWSQLGGNPSKTGYMY